MKVLLDLDACLASTPRHISKWAKDYYNVGPGDVPYSHEFHNIEKAWDGMSFSILKKIFRNKEFWETLPKFETASNFTKQLSCVADIHIVTDRRWYKELEEDTRSWLVRNSIKFNKLVICKGSEKASYAKEEGILLAIEDNVSNIELLKDVCPTVMIEWPYNKSYESENVIHAKSYYEAYLAINKLYPHELLYPLSVRNIHEQ